jgi:ERF superfamily
MTDKSKPEGDEDAFTRDMAMAQAEMENAAYNRVNPHFKSQYADYAAVRQAIAPAYRYGFRTNFIIRFEYAPSGEPLSILRLIVKHKSGHEEISERLIRGDTEQQQGSSITYGRRYLLSSYFGIASEDDDDGNAATSHGASQATLGRVQLSKEKSRSIYDALVKEMRSLTNQSDLTAWGLESTDRIYSMHDDFQRWFRDEYANHLTAIKEGVTEEGAELGEPE